MSLKKFHEELAEEISEILSSEFEVVVTKTERVPHSDDPTITFPNLDTKTQGAKLINSCVLYIDIRRSTELNMSHRPITVAKLYSSFIRAMTRVARYYNGHVRGIIGDRVMVVFDRTDAFTNSVHCAIAMNTVSTYLINRHFRANEVVCGIGIDAGNMLVTKTGIRRNGIEQANYRNLVWLGRPAHIASKLTDIANKPSESINRTVVNVAYRRQQALGVSPYSTQLNNQGFLIYAPSPLSSSLPLTALGRPLGPTPATFGWRWEKETIEQFISNVKIQYVPPRIVHNDPMFESFFTYQEPVEICPKMPSILMTERVWNEFRKANPAARVVTQALFKRIKVRRPGYFGKVYGGDVIFPDLKG